MQFFTDFGTALITTFVVVSHHFSLKKGPMGTPFWDALDRKMAFNMRAIILVMIVGLIYGGFTLARAEKVRFSELASFTWAYSCCLFVVICDVMQLGFARLLTKWRGENWVKELDYVYIGIGAVGLLVSANRLDVVSDKMTFPDAFGPVLLATALVIRVIKTRAEIGGWNKPPEPKPPAAAPS